MTLRSLLLSTVYRNTPDGAGGTPAPKPEEPAASAPSAPPAGDAPDPAAGGAGAPPAADPPAADPAAAAPAEAAADAPKEGDKDFKAETLLTGEEPKPDAKPEDKPAAPDAAPTGDKPAEGAKPEEGKLAEGESAPKKDGEPAAAAPEAPKVAPVYAYEFPEGMKVDDEALKPINETFAKHGIQPDVAKELMGLHVGQMKAYADQFQTVALEQQRDVWAKTRQTWREEIQSDEKLGGSGYQTTLRQAAEVRDRLVPKENMAAFNRMLLVTGVGDHPEFIRLMKSAHRLVGEPGLMNGGIEPTKNNGQPGGRRRIRDTYKTA